MRRIMMLVPFLLTTLTVAACDDLIGLGLGSVDGEWSTRLEGETVWIHLRDDRGVIRGSGEWGWDDLTVRGDRRGTRVNLLFRFDYDEFRPIEFEGSLYAGRLEGRIYGSGYYGERVNFRREY